jgi:hypothetical protein
MASSIENADIQQVREALRLLQAGGPQNDARADLPAVLKHLARYREFKETADPKKVRRGEMSFSRALELERIHRAEQLASRVEPGPAEEPARFAILSYAAASLELALPEPPSGEPIAHWDRFVFGTVNSGEVKADFGLVKETGYSLVYLSSALIDFLIQAAKAVVLAATVSVKENSARAEFSPEYIRERLSQDGQAADLLYRALEAYLFEGRPYAFPEETVDVPTLPLGTILSMAYRWVIGHEYGHGIGALIGDRGLEVGHRDEYFADLSATILTAYSACRLDGLPPDIGVAGGVFFLACHDILHRAVSIATIGREEVNKESETHPSDEARAIAIYHAYASLLEYRRNPDGKMDLAIRSHPQPLDPSTPAAKLMHSQVFSHANALFEIWVHVRSRLLENFVAGRKPHEMWQ